MYKIIKQDYPETLCIWQGSHRVEGVSPGHALFRGSEEECKDFVWLMEFARRASEYSTVQAPVGNVTMYDFAKQMKAEGRELVLLHGGPFSDERVWVPKDTNQAILPLTEGKTGAAYYARTSLRRDAICEGDMGGSRVFEYQGTK